MKNLKKNLTYQTVYQILITITPLITSPYLSRVLGAEKLGIYSYTQSLVNYFVFFAMLGFVNYGTRTIALAKDNEKEKIFCEIYYLQIFTTIVSLILYLIFSILYRSNTIYLLLQSLFLISCFFDVTWYFFGIENYKITVIRNIIIKILTVLSIILFIKRPEDLYLYIFIMSCSTLLSQFSLWIIILKKIRFHKIKFKESIKKHFKNVIVLFIPYLAMSIYHIMDKTMLGVMSSNIQNGYYYNSDKIVNIPLGILNGVGTVMLSKVSTIRRENNSNEKIGKVINFSISCISCLAIALGFGIAAISKDFVPFFFGTGYDECITLIKIFSVVIVFKAISDIIRTQYFIPFQKEKLLTICVVIGALTNFVANIILIKYLKLNALGATIGTLIAEFFVCFVQVIYCNKEFRILKSIFSAVMYIVPGIIMYFIVSCISIININIIIKLFLETLIGGIIYLIISYCIMKMTNKDVVSYIFGKRGVKNEN